MQVSTRRVVSGCTSRNKAGTAPQLMSASTRFVVYLTLVNFEDASESNHGSLLRFAVVTLQRLYQLCRAARAVVHRRGRLGRGFRFLRRSAALCTHLLSRAALSTAVTRAAQAPQQVNVHAQAHLALSAWRETRAKPAA